MHFANGPYLKGNSLSSPTKKKLNGQKKCVRKRRAAGGVSFLFIFFPKVQAGKQHKKKGLFLYSPVGVCPEKRNNETLQSWKERQAYMNIVTAANNLWLTSEKDLNIHGSECKITALD